MYDGIVQDLIDELGRLPGVGPKSAQRIAFHILQTESFDVSRLATLLTDLRDRVRFCDVCGNKEFTRRKDDNAETVKTRMAAYRAQTEPLLPYYGARGVLRKVDGMAPMDTVFRQISAVLAGT